jgi:hypothetical protein
MVDMWGVFFVGAMLGMLLPTVLMSHAVALSGLWGARSRASVADQR